MSNFGSGISRRTFLGISTGLSTSLLFAEQVPANVPQTMHFGIASVDITGKPGPELAGFLARVQPSTGIHRPLFARAAFLEQGSERLFWLIADSLGYTPELVARVKKHIAEKYDLEPWRILVQATHTHSAPSASRLSSCGEYNENYVETILLPGFFRAADAAKANAEPCQMVEATGQCAISIDRRNKPTKHTETRVPAIGWKRPDGSFKAVMLGYTMHSSSYVNGDISPDWPGATADAIRELFSQETEPFVFQGACGNINYPKKNFPYEELAECGRIIARTVADLLKKGAPSTPSLAVRAQPIDVQLDYLDLKGIEEFAGRMRSSLAGNAKGLQAVAIWEDWAKNYIDHNGPRSIKTDIAVALIGNRAFVTSPFETLSWMNLELAKHTNVECFAMGYTNGCYNYLSHDAAYDEGGYEPDTSRLWYCNFRMKRGELERLAENSAPLVEAATKAAGLK